MLPKKAKRASEGRENPLEGKRILIVDDEPDVLETIEDCLAMCKVSEASSFEQAKSLLESQSFDFAILDIMGVNGYEILKIANMKRVPAVMLTGYTTSPEDPVKANQEGAASYVPKEKLSDLEGVLNDILKAKEEGKSPWWSWHERFSSYFAEKFPSSVDDQRDYWKEQQVIKWEKFFY
jgi:DNA-binding NtrC family response regulator